MLMITTATSRETQELTKFLHHIGNGEQGEAEAMLLAKPQLATLSGDLTDCADRKFEKITGFQYSIWALDYHMWAMIKKYLNTEEAQAQVAGLNSGAAESYETQISWNSLIVALDTYVKNYDVWDWNQCNNYWCQQVGGAQLMLPAHVINEYSYPSRPLYPCSKWNGQAEPNLPRTGVKNWRKSGSYKLGYTFAWCRANLECLEAFNFKDHEYFITKAGAFYDHEALRAYLNARTEQAQALVSELTLRPGSTPRP